MEQKVFTRKLQGVIKSAKTQRDNVQELIVAGLVHYSENKGNTAYLTQLARACIGVRSLPTQTITDYIKAHANVGWGKLSDGKSGFRKVGEKGCSAEITLPEVTWYDWEGGNHNRVTPDYDFKQGLANLISTARKRAEEHKLKGGKEAEAQLSKLEAFAADL